MMRPRSNLTRAKQLTTTIAVLAFIEYMFHDLSVIDHSSKAAQKANLYRVITMFGIGMIAAALWMADNHRQANTLPATPTSVSDPTLPTFNSTSAKVMPITETVTPVRAQLATVHGSEQTRDPSYVKEPAPSQ